MDAKVKKGISIGVNIVIWAFLIFAIVMTVLVLVANATRGDGLPSIGGKSPVNVLSGSMEPEFYEGDMIYVHTITKEQKNQLEVGDVISFYFDQNNDGVANEVNTHRIVEVVAGIDTATYYFTKGDNRDERDFDPVFADSILGVYSCESLGIKGEKVTGCGSVLTFFQSPTGFMIFVVVPMAAFFIYELVNFVLIIVRLRGEKAAAARALSEEEIKQRAIEEYLREQEAKKASAVTANSDIAPFTETDEIKISTSESSPIDATANDDTAPITGTDETASVSTPEVASVDATVKDDILPIAGTDEAASASTPDVASVDATVNDDTAPIAEPDETATASTPEVASVDATANDDTAPIAGTKKTATTSTRKTSAAKSAAKAPASKTAATKPKQEKATTTQKPSTKSTTSKSGVKKPRTGGTVGRVSGTAKKPTTDTAEKPSTDEHEKK